MKHQDTGETRLSRYLHEKGNKLGVPVSGAFEITRKCDFNCKMCYVHSADTSSDIELSADEWLKIARDARGGGLLFLLLTGGEPFLRSDFPYLYKSLAKMGFVIDINSNASVISDEILDLFREYPPGRVNVTLYGSDEDAYKSLCGVEMFRSVIGNIKRLLAIGVDVILNYSINKYNIDDIDKVLDLGDRLDLTVRPTAYMFPSTRSKGDIGENEARLDPKATASAEVYCRKRRATAEQLKASAERYKYLEENDPYKDCEPSEGAVRCRAGRSSFWVNFDGTMSPCGMLTEPVISLKEHSFKECWDYIREKTAEIRLPSECSVCRYKDICHACAAKCYTETGAFNKVPPFICELAKNMSRVYRDEFLD